MPYLISPNTIPLCLIPCFSNSQRQKPQDGLTDESKAFLRTSQTVFDHIKNLDIPDFDFFPCGMGLWKAFEFELNATFIDWLRRQKGICDTRPTTGKPTLRPSEQIKIYSGRDRSGEQYFFVDINKHHRDDKTLIPVMLSELANLLQNKLFGSPKARTLYNFNFPIICEPVVFNRRQPPTCCMNRSLENSGGATRLQNISQRSGRSFHNLQ